MYGAIVGAFELNNLGARAACAGNAGAVLCCASRAWCEPHLPIMSPARSSARVCAAAQAGVRCCPNSNPTLHAAGLVVESPVEDYLLFVHEEHAGVLTADEAAAAQRLTSAGPERRARAARAEAACLAPCCCQPARVHAC